MVVRAGRPTLVERWWVLNRYGSLLLAAAVLLASVGAGVSLAGGAPSWIGVVLAVAAAAVAGWGVIITLRLPRKVHIVQVMLKRIERKGFRVEYFETLCGDLCMRRVTWLILDRLGMAHRHAEIVRAYRRNRSMFVEHPNPVIEDLLWEVGAQAARVPEAGGRSPAV